MLSLLHFLKSCWKVKRNVMSLRQVFLFLTKFKLKSKWDLINHKHPTVSNRNTFSTVTHLLLSSFDTPDKFRKEVLSSSHSFTCFCPSTWCSTLQCLVALIILDNRRSWIPFGFGQLSDDELQLSVFQEYQKTNRSLWTC